MQYAPSSTARCKQCLRACRWALLPVEPTKDLDVISLYGHHNEVFVKLIALCSHSTSISFEAQ
eukprot:985-Heterococcus_DN1.PRE.4